MNTKILVWNCQRARHPRFRNMISEYCKEFHPEILYLIETRVSGNRADSVITKLVYCNSFCVEANGFAGGI